MLRGVTPASFNSSARLGTWPSFATLARMAAFTSSFVIVGIFLHLHTCFSDLHQYLFLVFRSGNAAIARALCTKGPSSVFLCVLCGQCSFVPLICAFVRNL